MEDGREHYNGEVGVVEDMGGVGGRDGGGGLVDDSTVGWSGGRVRLVLFSMINHNATSWREGVSFCAQH